MAGMIVVVEYYEKRYGCEEKRIFKAFANIASFEDFCIKNGIQILKGAFGTTYYDDDYSYIVNHVECL